MFRRINADKYPTPASPFNPGPVPTVQWIEINLLVVDLSYQRDIGKRGTANIKNIAEHFEWSKFAPIIVAAIEGGNFALVDGQHRTTAAMMRGIKSVPCQIVQADHAQQAAAYSAVNGNVTKTTPQQLFHARVAARERDAVKLMEICSAAGVEIVRRNLKVGAILKGQTQAIGCLSRCLDLYGRDTLITSLQCIAQTNDGNPGMLRATFIEALCRVLTKNIAWRDAGEALLAAMDDFEFADVWEQAIAEHSYVLSPSVMSTVVETITDHLHKRMNKPPQKKCVSVGSMTRQRPDGSPIGSKTLN